MKKKKKIFEDFCRSIHLNIDIFLTRKLIQNPTQNLFLHNKETNKQHEDMYGITHHQKKNVISNIDLLFLIQNFF